MIQIVEKKERKRKTLGEYEMQKLLREKENKRTS